MCVSAFMPDYAISNWNQNNVLKTEISEIRLAFCVHILWTISDDWSLQFLVDNGSQVRMFRTVYNTKSTFSHCFHFCQLAVLYRLADNKSNMIFCSLTRRMMDHQGSKWDGMRRYVISAPPWTKSYRHLRPENYHTGMPARNLVSRFSEKSLTLLPQDVIFYS